MKPEPAKWPSDIFSVTKRVTDTEKERGRERKREHMTTLLSAEHSMPIYVIESKKSFNQFVCIPARLVNASAAGATASTSTAAL